MKKVILDTNFLIDIFRFKVSLDKIFEEIGNVKFVVPEFVIIELKNLSSFNPYVKLAFDFIKKNKIKIIKTKKKGDMGFFEILDNDSIVATNDSKLRKKLKALGIKSIYLRKRKKLEIG